MWFFFGMETPCIGTARRGNLNELVGQNHCSRMFIFHLVAYLYSLKRGVRCSPNPHLPFASVDRHIRGTRTHQQHGVESADDSFVSGINREVNFDGNQHL